MGATIRIYAESFERDPERHSRETQVRRGGGGGRSARRCASFTDKVTQLVHFSLQVVLGPLIAIALKISGIHERTGRRGPNIIT